MSAAGRVRSGARRGAAALVLVTLLGSCAGVSEQAAAQGPSLPRLGTLLFATAYDQVQEKYVRGVDMESMVATGLGGLSAYDQAFQVELRDHHFDVRYGTAVIAAFDAPPHEDPRRWANLSIAAVEAGRAASPSLRSLAPETVYEAVLGKAVSSLDTYSRYNSEETARENRALREGFGGIGITISEESGAIRVRAITPNTPASRAGLRENDTITHIEGEPIHGLQTRDVARKLRGPIGTAVNIEVSRAGATGPLRMALVRAFIMPATVTYTRQDNVAIIKLTGFNHYTTGALVEALTRARREIGASLAGIVLDMRGNLGGILDQAVQVADVFLARGTIVTTQGRHRGSYQASEARAGQIGEDLQVVVLVNSNSASAAEIVAAALQDNDRAVVIGTTSFGKGTVQTVIPLPNDGELVLTWARFHAPSGYPLQSLGLIPNICTSHRTEAGPVLADVRAGRATDAATKLAWRAVRPDDNERIAALRQRCRPEAEERAVDIEIARAILADKHLYGNALSGAALAKGAVAEPR